MITDYMKVKGVTSSGDQVSGWYVKLPKINTFIHTIITGCALVDGLPCENGDNVRTIRYREVVPDTIRRYLGIIDCYGRDLVERDLLKCEETGEVFRIEFRYNGEVVLVFLEFDSCISTDVQEFINDHKLKFYADSYSK